MKVKITFEGQPCRHCSTPVISVDKSNKKPKEKSKYYYTGYFLCPNKKCKAIYLDDARKVYKSKKVVLAWLRVPGKKPKPLFTWEQVFANPTCTVKVDYREEFQRQEESKAVVQAARLLQEYLGRVKE